MTREKEEKKAEEGKSEGPEAVSGGEKGSVPQPPIDFSTFIFSLSTAAQYHLGEITDPSTGKFDQNLPMAKQTIDILSMIEEKTKGNLSEDESKLLDNLLYTLRMAYLNKDK